MRAAVMQSFGSPLSLERVDDPVCAPDGAVVKVLATGVCRSDWHGWMGHDPSITLPHVGGHELCGEILEVGSEVHGFAPGDRVTVPFCCGCGVCEPCRLGETQVCERDVQPGFTIWGSFAELVALPKADLNLVRVPAELSSVHAASLGCRFMTAWAALHVHARVRAGEWVAVHGCGGVGLAAVMIAAAAGAQVIAVDIDERKLQRARELGAVAGVSGQVVASIVELTGGGAHVSLDALGSVTTCVNSVSCLRRRGRHAQVGLLLGDQAAPQVPMGRVISRELQVLGVHGMAVRHYDGMLRAVASGAVQPGELVAKTIGLDGVGEEVASMGRFAQDGVTVMVP
ncbi:alcohol dehydrogenase catalytic domain-containing protein [Solirubrobacter sp. CPCC 204708]|uniref:Alcohol dehydrogenase catalytic domain-containing protein n=1 Tax=Solirubrobacter deserti TaxID=2282478 RepID=A0ABT4RLN7_9ACTN|nr:alcohol dehydrogenase catalytic domain-containing protein [Solirubrobacter deserti]MBE2316729.1 alcohol dehydrogenase catalytic domain-containing protein [Solirubrobacter deserti]MDA0139485.1 alcohol dehydrogenase catalytic domain-containing protein [Solirubrobacter deserti]